MLTVSQIHNILLQPCDKRTMLRVNSVKTNITYGNRVTNAQYFMATVSQTYLASCELLENE